MCAPILGRTINIWKGIKMSELNIGKIGSNSHKMLVANAVSRSTAFDGLYDALVALFTKKKEPERHQVRKRTIRCTKLNGPMYYLGKQIIKRMESMGYPSKIYYCYRTPEEQKVIFQRGSSKARAWQSPHQYYEAVDIVHATKYWNASKEYWEALALCVRQVAIDFNVKLDHGHHWNWVDSAHIEIDDWRSQKGRYVHEHGLNEGKPRPPNQFERLERFKEVLPKVPFTDKEKEMYRDEAYSRTFYDQVLPL